MGLIRKKTTNIEYGQIIVGLIVLIIFFISCFYYYTHQTINDIVIEDINSINFVYQIEYISLKENIISLRGFCFKTDEDYSDSNKISSMRILLVKTDKVDEIQYYDAKYGINRPDVNEYYHNKLDYSNCGFETDIIMKLDDYRHNTYEVVIQPDKKNASVIRTGFYIENGCIINHNPHYAISLDVEGTDLYEIVENGFLRAYDTNLGIYVYQYNWDLYWITDEKYEFENGRNMLQLHVGTTSPEQLPKNRIEYGYDNLITDFFNYEITNTINCGKYRVAKRNLPNTYPITYITTGYNDGEWKWINRFCPGLPELEK